MNEQLVPVGITELRHPADGCFGFLHVEGDTALFQLRVDTVKILHFKRDRSSVARRLPSGMTANADGRRTKVVFDPRAFHRRRGWLQLERFLIKFSRAFLIRNCDGDKCDFLNHSHEQIPFSFSGFNLWTINLLPSGSWMIAM